MNTAQFTKSKNKALIEEAVLACESLRRNPDNPQDISLAEYVKDRVGLSMDALYDDLGLDTSFDTISNIFTLPDQSVRYIVPEIIRDAIRLGIRKAPIYPNLIAAEQTVKALSITVPYINMSDAAPRYVGEAEIISTGGISYGSKILKLRKIGRGIKITDEVKNYVAIDVVGIFLQDFGVKLGYAMDTLLVDVLLNGDQLDGSESAPIIGIAVPNNLVYRDVLTIWVRMALMGKTPSVMLGGENSSLDLLNLPEFKLKQNLGPTYANLNVKSPVPNSTDYYIHGAMPATQILIIDPSSTVVKYNAQPLLIETERIVSNQTEGTYATLTTGFAISFRDSRVVLDEELAFSANGFPSYMDPLTSEVVTID